VPSDVIAGRYRLAEQIGAGGMGVVWRAVDEQPGATRDVALKRVHLDDDMTPDERDRALTQLRREAEVAAKAPKHHSIVDVVGAVDHDGQPWLVMEYVPGRDLAKVVSEDGLLPVARAAHLGAQLAHALAHLHDAGIVHGDVTPRNVIVRPDDHVVLTDFGISRLESRRTLTTRGRPAGVLDYMPPEVAGGSLPSAASDVFGLGAVLHHALDGHGPWGTGEDRIVFARALKGVVAPSTRAGGLAPVLQRLTRKRPTERLSAAQAAANLEVVAAGGSVSRRPSRRVLIAIGAVVLLVVAAVTVGVAMTAYPPAPPQQPVASVGMSDQRTADPCALISAPALDRFGDTVLEPEYGNFDRCDVIIDPDGPLPVQATVELELLDPVGLPEGPREMHGAITVVRQPQFDGACERMLELPDTTTVSIVAKVNDGAPPTLCTVADTVTETALGALGSGTVPRRTLPPNPVSLANVDACSLLAIADLGPVPGLEQSVPRPRFGQWGCSWDTPDGPQVVVRYDRNNDGVDGADGTIARIGGRVAAMQADKDGQECDVTVLYRTYVNPKGDRNSEIVLFQVAQRGPVADACAPAVQVATTAMGRLPQAP